MSGMTIQTSIDSDHFIFESLNLALELVSDILNQIEILEFSPDQRAHFTNIELTKISLKITQFVELTTLISKFVAIKKNMAVNEIKNSHIHLLFVLKGINQSQLKRDDLVLEDLIKYELKDNLTQWKINIIPTIKRILNP